VLDMTGGEAESGGLPHPDGEFAAVLNRHRGYDPEQVRRVLRDDGVFLTEQVGALDGLAINEALGAPLPEDFSDWALNTARTGLEAAGLKVANGRTAFPERLFHDVGALVYFLRTVPGQVPDFSVEKYDKELRLLHDQMSAEEPFRDRAVLFLIEAVPA
jgi:SAM-dependent methyltransferase